MAILPIFVAIHNELVAFRTGFVAIPAVLSAIHTSLSAIRTGLPGISGVLSSIRPHTNKKAVISTIEITAFNVSSACQQSIG